jgi:gamma-glutamyltranspeptidase/glutathione hydrolase
MKKIAILFSLLLFFVLGLALPSEVEAVPVEAQKIMVSGPSPYAIEVAQSISKAGGNAVDVAVAVALSLAVTHPYYASLGGGGFAVVQVGSETAALDFRETAGQNTSSTFFVNKDKKASVLGGMAVAVPGIPAGLWALHKKYGALHWSRLFTIPIRLAEKGFSVSGEWASLTTKTKDHFNPAGLADFFKDGQSYLPGDILKQPKLARLLREMSNRGTVPFYEGSFAQDLVASVKAQSGVLTLQDMENYKVRWLKPLETDFAGYHLVMMPPPSSGGVVIETALKLVDILQLKDKPALSAEEEHGLAEVLKMSFLSRTLLGDPDFVKNPIETILSDKRLHELAKKYRPHHAIDPEALRDFDHDSSNEKAETTHISVMDSKGNAVAMTLTLNGSYGSGVVTDKYGVALNDEMDDFTTHPGQGNMYGLVQGQPNEVSPGKRPLSSMSPTLVQKNGKTIYAVGSPGGPRIISAVFQVLYRLLVSDFDIDQAIQAPRLHHQIEPNILYVDARRFSPDVLNLLHKSGYKTIEESHIAKVYVVKLNENGLLEGAFDSRGEGAAGGN